MYWLFLLFFILAVLIPDIIRNNFYFLGEERLEEIALFLLGMMAFAIFLKKEKKISAQNREREKYRKRLEQTAKDLIDSYSYIGEINRKIDILMEVALGLSEKSVINKREEKEIYNSIVNAANFILKADHTCLRFIDTEKGKTEKEINWEGKNCHLKNDFLTKSEENSNIIREKEHLIVSSLKEIGGVGSFFIIFGYDEDESHKPRNVEILRVMLSQALFLYAFAQRQEQRKSNA